MTIPLGIDLTLYGMIAAIILILTFYINFKKFKKDTEIESTKERIEHQKLHDTHDVIAKDNQKRIEFLEEYKERNEESNERRKIEIEKLKAKMDDEFSDIKKEMAIIQTNQSHQSKLLEKIDEKLDERK